MGHWPKWAQALAIAAVTRFSGKEQKLLHEDITGQGYGYEEIRDAAISLFPRLQKD